MEKDSSMKRNRGTATEVSRRHRRILPFFVFALLAAMPVGAAYAQQFEVISVGPQGQNVTQQQPGLPGQPPPTWGQTPVQVQTTSPQAGQGSQKAPSDHRPAYQPNRSGQSAATREGGAESLSSFEQYVLMKMQESADKEAEIVQKAEVPGSAYARQTTPADLSPRLPARSMEVRQFGYDLFTQIPSTFAPVENVPVGPDYVIGPDDEIRVTLWGKIEGQWTVRVDRDGNISVPRLGTLGVTGLTFKELKELLNREFSKYYTGFEMNVSMGSLRTIKVYVVGNASKPGSYTVSSLSTLVNALIEAGGPSKTGSMRDIQLKRTGKTIVHFDMYDLLLKGDKSKDIKLMPEDVIFIPTVGPLAAIVGNVKNPAIYEVKHDAALVDLLQMSGGLTGQAFKGRVQLQRIKEHEAKLIFEGDLLNFEKEPTKNFPLKDWDIVRIFVVPDSQNSIRITGAIAKPGELGITPGITRVKDIIAQSGGILYYASTTAELTRIKVTQTGPVVERLTIDISKALEGDPTHNILLEINDYIFVRAVPDWQLYRTVTLAGEIKYLGTYTIRKGERLSSVLERAGGYTESAYLRGAVFTRARVREVQQMNLEEMITRLERELLAESSTVRSASPEGVEARKVELQQKQAFIESLKRMKATGRLSIRLAHLRLLKGSEYDIELENNDTLFVPTNNKVVNVVGAVMSNTTLVHIPRLAARDYVQMAGGYSRYADQKNTYVLKADGSARKLSDSGVNWNDSRERWEFAGFGPSGEIESGDTIVVPEKLERIAWLREIKDITQILANVAVAAGAVYLFSTR